MERFQNCPDEPFHHELNIQWNVFGKQFPQKISIHLAIFRFVFQCAYTYPALNCPDFVQMRFHYRLRGIGELAAEVKSISSQTGTKFKIFKPTLWHAFFLPCNEVSGDKLTITNFIAAVILSNCVHKSLIAVAFFAIKSHITKIEKKFHNFKQLRRSITCKFDEK